MSSPAGTYDDTAGIPWDSPVVTIGETAFIAEDFTPDEGSSTEVSGNINKVPRAARHTRTLITGSCTLLFPAGSDLTHTPALFATFSAMYRGAAKNWVITKVGTPQKAGMETKLSIGITELLNAPAT